MSISRKIEKKRSSIQLGSVEAGEIFRFVETSFDTCISENLFYIAVFAPEKKDRVLAVNIADGTQLLRDRDRHVVVHMTDHEIYE